MNAMRLLFGDYIYDDIGFCTVNNEVIQKYAHTLSTLQGSNNTIRDKWIEQNANLSDIEILKEFCERAEIMWTIKLWQTTD